MILMRKLFTSTASFKPKFRKRFRAGIFAYVPAKDSKDEMLNHQAYREVAAEDEFKNNPETYKIRQGLFSKKKESKKEEDDETYPLFTKKYYKNLTNGVESQKQLFSWRLKKQNKCLGQDT